MFAALLDTCVLWPSLQRDVLLSFAIEGIYRPVWSSAILDELEYREEKKLVERDGVDTAVARSRAVRLIAMMRPAFDDTEVLGWEALDGTFGLPDVDDEHVVAAAVVAGAGVDPAVIGPELGDVALVAVLGSARHGRSFPGGGRSSVRYRGASAFAFAMNAAHRPAHARSRLRPRRRYRPPRCHPQRRRYLRINAGPTPPHRPRLGHHLRRLLATYLEGVSIRCHTADPQPA